MDREAWRAAVYGVAKSQTLLSYWTELNRTNVLFWTTSLNPFHIGWHLNVVSTLAFVAQTYRIQKQEYLLPLWGNELSWSRAGDAVSLQPYIYYPGVRFGPPSPQSDTRDTCQMNSCCLGLSRVPLCWSAWTQQGSKKWGCQNPTMPSSTCSQNPGPSTSHPRENSPLLSCTPG